MKQVCRYLMVVLAFLVVSGVVAPVDVSAEMVKKVDNFVIFIDQSGSMAWAKATPGNQKFEQSVDAVKRLEQVTPELGYNSSVAVFAPYKTVTQPATFKKGDPRARSGRCFTTFQLYDADGRWAERSCSPDRRPVRENGPDRLY